MISLPKKYLIGADLGGSHLTLSVLDESFQPVKTYSCAIDSLANASVIIEKIGSIINQSLLNFGEIKSIGIALPGPFDYVNGISCINGVGGKFSSIFGLNLASALKNQLIENNDIELFFQNDAICFGLGAYHSLKLESKRTIVLTLGTGFGSTFLVNGQIVENHPDLPENGAFYCEKFKDSIADDYFSSRWILAEFRKISNLNINSVKKLAELANENADVKQIFETFGANISEFLRPWILKFKCDTLIVGGNISKSWAILDTTFDANLKIVLYPETEAATIAGVAMFANANFSLRKNSNIESFRNSSQAILPLNPPKFSSYSAFPSFQLTDGHIFSGFDSLANYIIQNARNRKVIIDGFGGVLWKDFQIALNKSLVKFGKKTLWFAAEVCLKTEVEIDNLISQNLNNDDPIFGKKYEGELIDFFDELSLKLINPSNDADINILYGTGSDLACWSGLLIYLEVPKNEIQYRIRANRFLNLGRKKAYNWPYKQCYFVDWPVLNKHKQHVLPKIDALVDEQRKSEITWIKGSDLRAELDLMLRSSLRARPWFETGIWGGQWMKNKLNGLNQNVPNYAWSFELITPENGMILAADELLLEISFDFLLFRNNTKLLGDAALKFGFEFPIRFDFLDTFKGGNLSIQCHPSKEYIKQNFGENFTQDETYYILDCEEDAQVFLGFQDNIEPEKFKVALIVSQKSYEKIDILNYVQSFKANKHDLFLIPNGTVHASGKNNLVLEISSTPYIFTFKMYDWLRLDNNGQPRPINIQRAFDNLNFDRKGPSVENELISKPQILANGENYIRYELPTHPEHFYRVERYVFSGKVEIETDNQCHIGMLVEGECFELQIQSKTQTYFFAETFIVPAAVRKYTINSKEKLSILVLAYVKPEYCT